MPCPVHLGLVSPGEIRSKPSAAAHGALHRDSPTNAVWPPRPELFKFCRRVQAVVLRERRSGERGRIPVGPRLTLAVCTRRRRPSLLEYLSYNCNFMGVLAGPLCSYKDYITFIEGRSFHAAQSGDSGKEEPHGERAEPSPNVRPRLVRSLPRARLCA